MLVIVDYYIFDINFYFKSFIKHNVYNEFNISQANLELAFKNLFDYISNKTSEINNNSMLIDGIFQPFYNKRVLLHMVDVKQLLMIMKIVKNFSFVFLTLFFIYHKFVKKHFDIKLFFDGFKWSMLILISFIICLVTYTLVDFESFWINFHKVFFRNDLYLLDPKTDFLIRAMKLELFYDLVFKILVSILIVFGLLYGGLFILKDKNYD